MSGYDENSLAEIEATYFAHRKPAEKIYLDHAGGF